MLYTEKLVAELERTRALFASYDERYGQQRETWRDALAALGARYPNAAALRQALDAALATPTASRRRAADARIRPLAPSGAIRAARAALRRAFAHHEEARAWAERIRGTTTLAVDGSQLLPWRDASVPVALVQAGIFENPHQPPAPYLKDVRTELLPPDDLLASEPEMMNARTNEAAGYSERIVHLRRFELEMDTLVARMEHHAAAAQAGERAAGGRALRWQPDRLVRAQDAAALPERYAAAAQRLLAASRRMPHAADRLHRHQLCPRHDHDAPHALRATSYHPRAASTTRCSGATRWPGGTGRPPSSRRAKIWRHGLSRGADAVAFVYLRAARDRPPARLEFPAGCWKMPDGGLLDAVMDVCAPRSSPARATPTPSRRRTRWRSSRGDRARFYALFQQFAEREGLDFTFSRKALSKSRRRV